MIKLNVTNGRELSYVEAAMYAFPYMKNQINTTGTRIRRKALATKNDILTPVDKQADKIAEEVYKLNLLVELKLAMNEILKEFTDEEKCLFKYAFVGRTNPEDIEEYQKICNGNFRYGNGQNRRRIRLVDQMTTHLAEKGFTDEWFEADKSRIDIIHDCLIRRLEHQYK